jgi:hypothetical protein
MMAISQNEVEFALRLWQSLVPNGEWILPKVGKYIRTGETELTLVEMYSPTVSANERSLFDHHDFIAHLGNEIGWNIALGIERAFDSDGDVLNIPKGMIGDVAVCSCGLVIRVEPANPWQVYQQVVDGKCPHCKKNTFDSKWNNIHVVTDKTAIRLKESIREEE